MKKIIFVAIAVLCICGCNSDYLPVGYGEPVKFSSNDTPKGLATKAYYPGIDAPEHSGKIFWDKGDLVSIYCGESSSQSNIADYVAGASDPKTGYTKLSSDPGLAWGVGTHTFYAVYPSPHTEGKSADGFAFGGDNHCYYSGHIPAAQSISSKGNSTISDVFGYYTQPEMTSLYMVAKKESFPTSEAVNLNFKSIVTAIRFVIRNTDDTDWLHLFKASLTSKSFLCGPFRVDFGGWNPSEKDYPVCDGLTSGDNKVTLSLGDDGLSVAPGDVIAITFILPPTQDFNDLTLTLTKENGAEITKELKNSKTGEWFTFRQNRLSYATMSVAGTATEVSFIGSPDSYDIDAVSPGFAALISKMMALETGDPGLLKAYIESLLVCGGDYDELEAYLTSLGISQIDADKFVSALVQFGVDDINNSLMAEVLSSMKLLTISPQLMTLLTDFLVSDISSPEVAAALLAHLITDVPSPDVVATLSSMGMSEADADTFVSVLQSLGLTHNAPTLSVLIYSMLVDNYGNAVTAILDDLGIAPHQLQVISGILSSLDLGTVIAVNNSIAQPAGYDVIVLK